MTSPAHQEDAEYLFANIIECTDSLNSNLPKVFGMSEEAFNNRRLLLPSFIARPSPQDLFNTRFQWEAKDPLFLLRSFPGLQLDSTLLSLSVLGSSEEDKRHLGHQMLKASFLSLTKSLTPTDSPIFTKMMSKMSDRHMLILHGDTNDR
jgi:hypothetical protein